MELQAFHPKTTIDDLPPIIQAELSEVLRIAQKSEVPLKMFWLYGSYSRGEQINRREISADGALSEYHSDLDVLMVLENTEKGEGNTRKRQKNQLLVHLDKSTLIQTKLHVLFVTADVFDRGIAEDNYFYADVLKEGRLLFTDGHPLVERQRSVTPQLKRRRAEAYFREYFQVASGFREGFEFYYQTEKYSLALFMLNQMTEHLLHTMLLVFRNYKFRSHDLSQLSQECAASYPKFIEVMHDVPPQEWIGKKANHRRDYQPPKPDPATQTPESKLWGILQEAYVNARYSSEFVVTQEQAEALGRMLHLVQEMVYHACAEKVQSYVWEVPLEKLPCLTPLDMDHLNTHPIPQAELATQKAKLDQTLRDLGDSRAREEAALKREEDALYREKEALKEKEEERLEKEEALIEKEDAIQREEEALMREEMERTEKEDALNELAQSELERLRLEALLRKQGINPN